MRRSAERFFYDFGSLFGASGVHFGGLRPPLGPFWPLGAPRRIPGPLFSIFFGTLGAVLGPKDRPREAPRAPKRPKGPPKRALGAQKGGQEGLFGETADFMKCIKHLRKT